MVHKDVQITASDLSTLLGEKVNQCTYLELRLAALTRLVADMDETISSLRESNNVKGDLDAEGGNKEIWLHNGWDEEG